MKESDNYPIGAIVIYGGNLDENSNWLLCNGNEFNTQDYPELYAAISNLYGGDPTAQTFRIPDFLGVFLKGANEEVSPLSNNSTSKNNPLELIRVKQEYTTKKPNGKSFSAAFQNLPLTTTRLYGLNKDGVAPDGANSVQQATCTSGGNKESRPINVYVNYYIKAH